MTFKQILKKLIILQFFCTPIIYAQTVTGEISSDGIPLAGANVIIKGSSNGVVSDFDGIYTIDDINENDVLVYSYIGFVTKEVIYNGQSKININLIEDVNKLDEIVVVGYGTQKKSTLTAAVSTVKAEQIREIPATDVAQTLQGRAPGVTVTKTGNPGGRTAIRIRGLGTFGDGDPLYVVDGIFTNSINNISPSSITKIDVLKDAAATAIYGSRGANGVIIVSTNRGEKGKTKFTFNTYTGIQNSNKRYDLLNTEEYIQYLREISAQTDGGGTTVDRVVNDPTFDGNGIDTAWQDQLFRRDALVTNFDFTASGGSENSNFSFGASTFDQDGIYIDTNFKRHTFNISSDAKINKKFKVGQTLALGFTETIAPEVSGGREPIFNIIASAPYIPVVDENGLFTSPESQDVNNARNQVLIQDVQDNLNRRTSIIGNIYAELEIAKGLTFKSQLGLDMFFNLQDDVSRAYETTGQFNQNFTSLFKERQNFNSTIFTNTLNYNKSFGNHNFNLTLVSENIDSKNEISSSSSQTELSSEITEITNGIANTFVEPEKLISYLGRINYDFDSKYLLQASIRRDKSSEFPEDGQVGWFPAASIGWVASKEAFLEDTPINNLKFRGSYGITGNNKLFPNTVNLFDAGLGDGFIGVIDGQTNTGVSIVGANNSNLVWEEKIKQNYGFDLGLWDNKITFSAEYFVDGSEDLLVPVPQAPSTAVPGDGLTGVNLFQNVGAVDVKGVEFTIGYNDNEGDFKWNFWANVTHSESEVTDIGSIDQILLTEFNPPFSEQLTRIAVGEPLFHFFGYEFEGVYSTNQEIIDHIGEDNLDESSGQAYIVQQGDVRYKDINGDGDITAEDRVVIGDPFPDFTYSANISMSYKNWDLNALITGVSGVDALNANNWFLEGQENVVNHGTAVLDRWQNPGDITDVPRFRFEGNNPNNFISTRFIEDASYARLRNLTIGYSLNQSVLNNLFNGSFTKIRLYIQSQNLFTITNYSGLDPEIEPFYNENGFITGLNVDRGRAPQPRTFITGLQIEF